MWGLVDSFKCEECLGLTSFSARYNQSRPELAKKISREPSTRGFTPLQLKSDYTELRDKSANFAVVLTTYPSRPAKLVLGAAEGSGERKECLACIKAIYGEWKDSSPSNVGSGGWSPALPARFATESRSPSSWRRTTAPEQHTHTHKQTTKYKTTPTELLFLDPNIYLIKMWLCRELRGDRVDDWLEGKWTYGKPTSKNTN